MAHVSPDPQDAGLFFLFYAYPNKLAGNGAVLAALVSGSGAVLAALCQATVLCWPRWCQVCVHESGTVGVQSKVQKVLFSKLIPAEFVTTAEGPIKKLLFYFKSPWAAREGERMQGSCGRRSLAL
eukprot:1141791-Pelagomonas_calceolata.AAC.6